MLGQLSLTALAALSVVNGSPVVQKRQVTSAVESAASSAASSVAASATSLASDASSAVSGASSTAMDSASMATGAASTAMSSAMSSGSSAVASATSSGNATGTESFPLFPCPPGYLLTYVNQNATVPLPITNVTPALGEWASSPIFPNVTNPVGGSQPGATHTINIAGLAINEVLVNATSNSTSGYASFTWNLTNGPIQAPGVSISNWTAELNVYDPDFSTTGMIGNTTVADAFVNFCASDQAAGAGLLNSVLQLYLGNAAMALQGNSTAGAMTTGMESMMSSTMMESSTMMDSMASSTMMSGTEMASSMATSATAAASSAASSAASGAESAAASATSVAAGAASSAAAAATSG